MADSRNTFRCLKMVIAHNFHKMVVGCAKRNLSASTFSEYFITASSFVMEMHADSRSVAAGFGEALVVFETNTTSLFTTM